MNMDQIWFHKILKWSIYYTQRVGSDSLCKTALLSVADSEVTGYLKFMGEEVIVMVLQT